MYISDDERFGMQLRVLVENGENSSTMKFPIFSSTGRMDAFVESLVDYMPNLEIGKTYRFFPYAMDTKSASREAIVRRGVSVKYAEVDADGKVTLGDKVEKYLTFIGKDDTYDPNNPTHLPPLNFVQGLNKKFTPDAVSVAQRKQFLEALLQAQVERLDSNATNDQAAPQAEAAPAAKVETPKATSTVSDDVPKAVGAQAAKKSEPAAPANVIADGIDDEDDDDLPF